jgi:DNA polymerase alpha subunit B
VSVKINDSSVMIESSRMMGSGARVPLRFDPGLKIRQGKDTVGLFPGAIMALRGRNGGGGWFSVTEVLSVSINDFFCWHC